MSNEAENKTVEDLVSFEVDGQTLQAAKGSMLIRATDAAGITIPRFCYHKNLSVAANCRMCLVEVEKAPKPLPACATPVMEGMKVFTQSEVAKRAQKGVMEFLLINHPLDCPICDQGGECTLQDLAVGYGDDSSRYLEAKRVVMDKNIGPLIATEMTRCIHCTRCVRFGQEVAGIMEMGGTGRGEHMKIGTYIENSIDSELSGNIIDLCPVGALTSKPFRYSARSWELVKRASISPHDNVGANITVHTRDNKVMRVVARENNDVNETWISDRDRFSYEANDHNDRLTTPMIKVDNEWQETDWNSALEFTLRGLDKVIDKHGVDKVGALAAPHSSTEEFYLLQKFIRTLGSGNVDHRVGQMDFTDDEFMPEFPGLGQSLQSLENSKSILLIGSNVRKDQPLIGYRIRKAQKNGASLMAINPVDYDFASKPELQSVGTPQQMLESLAGVIKALASETSKSLPADAEKLLSKISAGDTELAMAKVLLTQSPATILLGNYAFANSHSSQFRALAQLAADLSGAQIGFLAQANSAGAWLAGCVPHRGTKNSSVEKVGATAHDMIKEPLKAYIMLGLEPELDCIDAGRARLAMEGAEFNVMVTSFKPAANDMALDCANVMLPMATHFETAGTHINCEGKVQAYRSTVTPLGESRPAWKVLRVLGNYFELEGFDQDSIDDVRKEINIVAKTVEQSGSLLKQIKMPKKLGGKVLDLYRLAEAPIYRTDSFVRRASALQATNDNPGANARVNSDQAAKLDIKQGDVIRVRMLEGDAEINVEIDERIPDACIWVPAGYSETSALGACGSSQREQIMNIVNFITDLIDSLTAWAGLPDWLQVWIHAGSTNIILIVVIMVPLMTAVAYLTLAERKVIGYMQGRIGPNRVGPRGLLQPIADAVKLMFKEIILPTNANKFLFLLAPVLSLGPALAAWAVIPFDDGMVLANVDASLLYVLALTSVGVYGIIIAGWASNSKYAFLGAMRSAAQIVSYEIAMGFALVGVLMAAGSLNLHDIVMAQSGDFRDWYIWPLFPLFMVYYISGVAETNRAPFDVAEGESEIVAGFHVEYSGMTFAVFFLAEYANIILISALTAIMFLGGWHPIWDIAPFNWIPNFVWLLGKIAFFAFFFLWFRATFPRYRYDQIMRLGWKILIPVTLVWIVVMGCAMFLTPFGEYFH